MNQEKKPHGVTSGHGAMEQIGTHKVLVWTEQDGTRHYYHSGYDKWFATFETHHGGDLYSTHSWLQHQCEGITPQSILFPERAQWTKLAETVRNQSARLAAL